LNPSFKLILTTDVHVKVIVQIGEYAGIDERADEECNSRGSRVFDFDIQRFRFGGHEIKEEKLNIMRSTRKKTEKAQIAKQ